MLPFDTYCNSIAYESQLYIYCGLILRFYCIRETIQNSDSNLNQFPQLTPSPLNSSKLPNYSLNSQFFPHDFNVLMMNRHCKVSIYSIHKYISPLIISESPQLFYSTVSMKLTPREHDLQIHFEILGKKEASLA